MSVYTHIIITPRTATLDKIIEADSEYNQKVAEQTRIAEMGPELLAMLKNVEVGSCGKTSLTLRKVIARAEGKE